MDAADDLRWTKWLLERTEYDSDLQGGWPEDHDPNYSGLKVHRPLLDCSAEFPLYTGSDNLNNNNSDLEYLMGMIGLLFDVWPVELIHCRGNL